MGTVIGFAPPAATVPAVNERFTFAFQVLIGYTVEVQVKAGGVYQGIFRTAQLENSELHVVLHMAKLVKDADQKPIDSTAARRPIKELIIKSADLVSLTARDIRMGADDLSGPVEDAFSTDTAISRGRGGLAGRELQKWAPEASDDLSGMLLESTTGPKGKGSAKWDQFAANQQLFGTATSYNEDLYTTKLDTGASAISVQEAERLAAEIQGGVTSNRHMAEERGAHINDSGIDEEDLYSAVGRQPHAAEPDEQEDAAEEEDALNADTFGQSALGSALANNGAGPARTAWTSAGASVALVAGSSKGGSQEPASSSRSSATQPIDMSMRAEHNKVRTHLAGSKKDRSSPYGTPIAKSPLSSPLIADAAALEALNLNPGIAKFDNGTLRSFQDFKLQQAAKKAAQQRSPRISPSAISMSPSEASVLDQADPLREDDSDVFGAAAASPSKPSPGSATSSAAASTPASANPPAASAAPAADTEAAADTSGSSANPAAEARSEPAGTSGNVMGAASGAEQPSGTPKSKLNPFAREFKLNVNAPSFTPGSKPPALQGSALPSGGPAQGAGPGPAAAVPPSQPSGGPRPRAPYSHSHSHSQASVGSTGEEGQARPVSASQHAASRSQGSHGRPASSPPGRRGLSPAASGGQVGPRRQPYMQSSEQMWAQSQGMHMGGGRASGHMPMQGGMPMQMSGGYMVPGMMPGMPHMGGSPDQMMGYMPNNMRPYSHAMGYGMMPGRYGMMYGPQMDQPTLNARPPMYSQGYQAPMHPSAQQIPLNQAMSGSLDRQNSASHPPHPNTGKRQ